jgi:putative heme-binding domain-containing protein
MLRIFVAASALIALCLPAGSEPPRGLPRRTPWTTSRIKGTPDPPHPYRIELAFPKLTFKNPLLLTRGPGTDRLFIAEQAGKIFSFRNDDRCEKADLFLDLTKDIHSWDPKGKVKGIDAVYGLAFHPNFEKNRYCYICYVLNSKTDPEQVPDGSRVSRFRVTNTDPPRCDPASEKIILTWLAGGHNGGDLHFGPDGYLYISTGDGSSPNPPDALDTGQNLTDLLSCILRIDVDHEANGRPYTVPTDNPFVKVPKACPEIWAYGFRNPWRMGFDRVTGDLWVGDVGWEKWEMIYRVQRGGNYGWSVMEGPQPVRPGSKRGPTPILPPNLAFPHTEAASITGGYVYRGKRLKDLVGVYICGDWVTRKLWGTRFDGDKVVWHKELAQGTQRVVAFGEDHAGELSFVNYDDAGSIHRLVPNEKAQEQRADFPRKLSETGLFRSVKEHQPAPGVVPFSINAAQWIDGASAERLVALPGSEPVRLYDNPVSVPGAFFSGAVFLPKDGVLAKTITLELERGNPRSRRRLETQVLHYDGETWHGYSYKWNDAQTDADLVPAGGADERFTVIDPESPGGKRRQTWHFASRGECLTCHNPWTGFALGFNLAQLNGDHDYCGMVANQLRAFKDAGLVTLLHHEENAEGTAATPLAETAAPRLTDPGDAKAKLAERARAYLHVNCSHCHQFGAGGTADIELRHTIPLDKTKIVDVRPVQGTFGMADARIVAPGDPYRSVLFYRMAKLGPGRMPHISSEVADERGLRLIHDWIRALPIHNGAGGVSPLSESRLRGLTSPAQTHAKERAETIRQLLSTTSSALMLAQALAEKHVPDSVSSEVLAAAASSSDGQVRDLFERFLPDEQRVKRLGTIIRPEPILSLKGDTARGRELFLKSAELQCINCHRVGSTGSTLGPDLSEIGKKLTRAQILESILEPSKTIEPKYASYVLETSDGQIHTGVLAARNDREVVLRVIGDREVRVPAGRVASLIAQRTSLMPEQLLRDVTAEQAADLLEFLASLR